MITVLGKLTPSRKARKKPAEYDSVVDVVTHLLVVLGVKRGGVDAGRG